MQKAEDMTSVVREARERVYGLTKSQLKEMPHSSELGRLRATGEISPRQYEAGSAYIEIVRLRNRMIEAKSYPLAGDLDRQGGFDGEDGTSESYKARYRYAEQQYKLAQSALRDAAMEDRLCPSVVDAVCLNDWKLPAMTPQLRVGLNHLARALGIPSVRAA